MLPRVPHHYAQKIYIDKQLLFTQKNITTGVVLLTLDILSSSTG